MTKEPFLPLLPHERRELSRLDAQIAQARKELSALCSSRRLIIQRGINRRSRGCVSFALQQATFS